MNLLDKLRIPYRDDSLFGLMLISIFFIPIFFYPLLRDPFESSRFVLTLLAVGAALLILSRRSQIEFRARPVFLFSLLLFTVCQLLAFVFSIDHYNSVFGIYGRQATSVVYLALWIIQILLFLVIISKQKVLTLARALVLSGSLVAILGIFHNFGIGFYAGISDAARPIVPGFIGNQNFSAIFLTGVFPLLLLTYSKASSTWAKIYYAIVGLLMIWGLVIFASRGGLLAFGISLLVMLALLVIKRSPRAYLYFILGCGIVGLIFAWLFFYSARGINDSGNVVLDNSSLSRVLVWKKSLELIKDSPWTGLGHGNFYIGFESLQTKDLNSPEKFDDAHNLPLHLATSLGVPTALAFLLIVLVALVIAFRDFWRTKSLTSLSVMGGILGIVISTSFSPVNISNWMLLSFLLASSQVGVQSAKLITTTTPKKLVLWILGGLSIIIGVGYFGGLYFGEKAEYAYRARSYEEAIKLGNYSKTFNPFSERPIVYIVASEVQTQRDVTQTRADIEKLVQYHPHASNSYKYAAELYAMLYKNTGEEIDRDKSLDYLKDTYELQSDYAETLMQLSFVAYNLGDKQLAEQYIVEGINLSNQGTSFHAWILYAELQLESGRITEMEQSLRQAYAIDKNLVLRQVLFELEQGQFNRDKLPIEFPPVDI